MATKKLKDKTLRVSGEAHVYLRNRAFKESTPAKKKEIKKVVDELCFPKRIPIKGSVS